MQDLAITPENSHKQTNFQFFELSANARTYPEVQQDHARQNINNFK